MGNRRAITRELINEEISPQEERAYLTWMSARPADEIKAMQEYGVTVRALFLALQELRAKECEPSAPEAQALITEWNALAVRYGLREYMAALNEWNPVVAQKWLRVGERALSFSVATAPDEGLWAYFGAAQAASPWHQALKQTADEAAKLSQSRTEPSSAPAMALASRLAAICSDHSLGNPLVYARWAGAMQFRGSPEENVRRKGAWAYLANALREDAARGAMRG